MKFYDSLHHDLVDVIYYQAVAEEIFTDHLLVINNIFILKRKDHGMILLTKVRNKMNQF